MSYIIHAKIKSFLPDSEKGRKQSIHSGYRPTFKIYGENYYSGQITLINKEKLNPGEECEAEIKFIISATIAEQLLIGRKVVFSEAIKPIGEAIITKIIGYS